MCINIMYSEIQLILKRVVAKKNEIYSRKGKMGVDKENKC